MEKPKDKLKYLKQRYSGEKKKLTERIEIRVSPYEKNFIKGLANIYSNGNVSLFLIYAALNTQRKFLDKNDLCESKRMVRDNSTSHQNT